MNTPDTPMLKVLLVDDNSNDLKTMGLLLSRLPFVQIVAKETSSLMAYDYASKNKIDVLISDMVMDDMDGVHLMDALEDKPEVIFISSHLEQAARSYGSKVKYWFHKPVSFASLKEALEEIYKTSLPPLFNIKASSMRISAQLIEDEKLGIKRKWCNLFHFNDIAVFNSYNNYVLLTKTDGTVFKFRATLSTLESFLPTDIFQRVHKGFIVNLYKCERFSLQSKASLVFVKGYPEGIPLNDAGVELMRNLFEMVDVNADDDKEEDEVE